MPRKANPNASTATRGLNKVTGKRGQPFQKGHPGGPGRPPGVRDRTDKVREELTAKAITEGMMPLEFFLEVMRNEKRGLAIRMDAAKSAAPYVHKRQPMAVEIQEEKFKVFDISHLEGLSDEELEVMHGIMVKAAQAEAKAAQNPFLPDPRVLEVPSPRTPPDSVDYKDVIDVPALPAIEYDGPIVVIDPVKKPWEA